MYFLAMVKGMESLNASDIGMGNGQTNSKCTEHDSGHHLLDCSQVRKSEVARAPADGSMIGSEVSNKLEGNRTTTINKIESIAPESLDVGGDCVSNNCSDETFQGGKLVGRLLAFNNSSLRELLLLHLDLMEQQQAKLQEKDRMIAQLRVEKDQLEARLTRMERRMAVQRKHTVEDGSEDLLAANQKSRTSVSQIRGLSSLSATPTAVKRPRYSFASAVTITSRQSKDCGLGAYVETESAYLHQVPTTNSVDVTNSSKDKKKDIVVVPSFRIIPESQTQTRSPSRRHDRATEDSLENLDDETFFRRHQKLELDEKRRKRWDIQHTRHQRQQENLKLRQKERDVQRKSKGKKRTEGITEKPLVNSLMPDPEKLIAIEVSSQVPVSAFGSRLVALQQKEFNLPWFDIAKKEVQLRQMKEKREKREKDRQRKRTRRRNSRRW